jgi:hypothetical protein
MDAENEEVLDWEIDDDDAVSLGSGVHEDADAHAAPHPERAYSQPYDVPDPTPPGAHDAPDGPQHARRGHGASPPTRDASAHSGSLPPGSDSDVLVRVERPDADAPYDADAGGDHDANALSPNRVPHALPRRPQVSSPATPPPYAPDDADADAGAPGPWPPNRSRSGSRERAGSPERAPGWQRTWSDRAPPRLRAARLQGRTGAPDAGAPSGPRRSTGWNDSSEAPLSRVGSRESMQNGAGPYAPRRDAPGGQRQFAQRGTHNGRPGSGYVDRHQQQQQQAFRDAAPNSARFSDHGADDEERQFIPNDSYSGRSRSLSPVRDRTPPGRRWEAQPQPQAAQRGRWEDRRDMPASQIRDVSRERGAREPGARGVRDWAAHGHEETNRTGSHWEPDRPPRAPRDGGYRHGNGYPQAAAEEYPEARVNTNNTNAQWNHTSRERTLPAPLLSLVRARVFLPCRGSGQRICALDSMTAVLGLIVIVPFVVLSSLLLAGAS